MIDTERVNQIRVAHLYKLIIKRRELNLHLTYRLQNPVGYKEEFLLSLPYGDNSLSCVIESGGIDIFNVSRIAIVSLYQE